MIPTATAMTNAKNPWPLINEPSIRAAEEACVAADEADSVVLPEAPPAVAVAPVVAVVVLPALVVVEASEEAAWDEAWDEAELAADVLEAAELAVVLLLELGILVELLTRVRRGVKLYSSGPTLDTLDAGPSMIWTA
jgi:hypothetical protein